MHVHVRALADWIHSGLSPQPSFGALIISALQK